MSAGSTTIEPMFDTLADTDLLGSARAQRATADAAEARLLVIACEWADAHPATELESIATYVIPGGDRPWMIAGPGCPLVAEFAVHEFGTAIGLGAEGGKHLIGEALELRHRLPRVWARVQKGEVQAWRARRIAAATIPLSPDAAAHVDRHLAPVAHSVRPWQIDKLVAATIATFMPELAEEQRQSALDRRHVTIETSQVAFDGTCWLEGVLDLPDAQDLEHALRAGAEAQKAGGSEESLDARRSIALGDLARGQTPLDLTTPDLVPSEVEVRDFETGAARPPQSTSPRATKPPHRQILLHLHLSEAATTGWVEEGRNPVTADTIRDWCGRPSVQVVVKPVIDLNTDIAVDGYDIPDRIRDHVTLRDRTCVFPYCTRPARHADLDHIEPYDPDGPPGQTATDNLAPTCRTHHRLKTHDHRGSADHRGWTYTPLEPGVYLWRSPTGLTFLRHADGTTTDLTHDPRRD